MKKYSISMDDLKSYSNSVERLREVLEDVPENATYDLSYIDGDRPWESGYYTLTFHWSDK